MKRLIPKALGALLGAAALVMLFVGPRSHAIIPAGRIRVQYWEKWTGHEAAQIREMVDRFNQTVGERKGIWIDLVSMSQIDRKTLISTAAGVPPDLVGLTDTSLCEFAATGALESLDSYAVPRGLVRSTYKPVIYDGCCFQEKLYALPSTPWAPALLWNKQIFQDKAPQLRAAGLDPDHPPRTLQELDRYAAAIDTWQGSGSRRLSVAGYIPTEPGWFVNETVYWFGGDLVDPAGRTLQLTSPAMHAAFNWVRSYAQRLGPYAMNDFRSGFGGFDSPQNAFLSGKVAMVLQGPWMASFIEKLAPAMNRWHVPADELAREKAFSQVSIGMQASQLDALLGMRDRTSVASEHEQLLHWPGGIKDLFVTLKEDRVTRAWVTLLPAIQRQQFCQWGVASFPSAVPGLNNVTYAGMDLLVIPRGSTHKREAFEFIAFLNQQEQMEHLCSMHCVDSPLAQVSDDFVRNHPNPYIDVFETLAASPNARPLPPVPTWPQLADELAQVTQQVSLLNGPTDQMLAATQARAQQSLDRAQITSSTDVAR